MTMIMLSLVTDLFSYFLLPMVCVEYLWMQLVKLPASSETFKDSWTVMMDHLLTCATQIG